MTTQHSSNEICDMYDRLERWGEGGEDSPEFNPDSDLATVTHQRATTCDSGKKYAMICRTLVVRPPLQALAQPELSIFTVMDDDKCSPETNYMIIRMQEYIQTDTSSTYRECESYKRRLSF